MNTSNLLLRGLVALASAGHKKPSAWPEGHWGAAVLSTHFLCENHGLDPSVTAHVARQAALFMTKKPEYFSSIPPDNETLSIKEAEERILAAFAPKAGLLCAIGHNVIYTTLTLRALRAAPEARTPFVVDGIAQLVSAFGANPGYFLVNGKPMVIHPRHNAPNPYGPATPLEVYAAHVLDQFRSIDRTYAEELGDMQVGHILTHGEAVTSLLELGHEQLAREAFGPFLTRMALFAEARQLSPRAESPPPPEFRSPTQESFWALDFASRNWWGGGHVFKYTHSLLTLLKQAGQTDLSAYGPRFALLDR